MSANIEKLAEKFRRFEEASRKPATMPEKVAELERQTTASNPNGTFGFSVLGGAGTKFPAVVCEVDRGGPAARSGKIKIGDKLTVLNGELLQALSPNELVQSIRSAPSPSTFVLEEDECLREQVLALLKRQQEKAEARQKKVDQQNMVKYAGRDNRKGRRDKNRVLEVESSVNRSGGDGHIVQVVDNRIIPIHQGAVGEEGCTTSGKKSPRHHNRSPMVQRAKGSPPKLEDGVIPENGTTSSSPGFIHRRHSPGYSTGSPERNMHLLAPVQGPTKSASMDNFSARANNSIGETVTKEINGIHSRSYSSSLGLNHTPDSGSLSSFDEKERGRDQSEDRTCKGSPPSPATPIHIPHYPNPVDNSRSSHRGSLSEDVLVNELTRPGLFGNSENTESNEVENQQDPILFHPTSPKWSDSAEDDSAPVRSNSYKRADDAAKAVTLGRKLYMLDGFKKSEVAEVLAKSTEFGQAVAKEYLSLFDFTGQDLEASLRQFLSCFSLTGESQERERIMQYFSERYHQCNPQALPSRDAVHGLSIAVLLLNTDLHSDHGGRKMNLSQFYKNLEVIGFALPKDMLKRIYDNIKRHPLEWAQDDEKFSQDQERDSANDVEERIYHVNIPGTFVQAELPSSAPVLKEGFIMKKNIMEAPHKKVPRGKRQWKAYYAYMKGFLLYFAPPQGQGEIHLDDTSSAMTITHCLAMRAHDYQKKSSVVRVTTADWHVFLLQATNVTDMQQWMGAINKAASLYSSPPLAAPIGSQAGFNKPTFPLAPTRNSQEQQVESHEAKIKSLEKEMKEHQALKPNGKGVKHGRLEEWFDQYEFLQFEINRFRIYLASLSANVVVDFTAPIPSGLIPSPSISTLHNPDHASGESDFLEDFHRRGHTTQISRPQRSGNIRELQSHSPLLSRHQYK